MKILLTGGRGMVGRNILEHLCASEYIFLAPDSSTLNLEDYNSVDDYIKLHQPDFIIHAAGLVGGIQANIKNPVNFLVRNTDMGRNIIVAARNNNIKYLMNLSSSCIYPRYADPPLKEEFILQGELEPTNEGYAIAKIFATRLCEYIVREDSNFLYKTVIPCNLYGKYDKFSPEHSHMLPAVIRKIYDAKLKKLESVDIWSDGLSKREFMYAEDLADFIFYALKNFEKMPQNLNVGLGHDYTINEYYIKVAKIIGFTGNFNHDLSKPAGMKQKLMDIARLKEFGWEHKTTLEEGIQHTYNYFKTILND